VQKALLEGEIERKRAEIEAKKELRLKNQAWSTKKDLHEKKVVRREKKEIRSRAISLAQSKLASKAGSAVASLSGSRATSRMGSRAGSPPPGGGGGGGGGGGEDEDDMAMEVRLMKKLKRGLISREQFDKETGWDCD